ncbi:MAG: aminotransferase class IV [Cytophagaceae bacterium]|nr:aminotransferase class IV [Cytophagaceae bacterium]
MLINWNGRIVSPQELSLGNNRAFQYADGFFEVLIVKEKKILAWELHLNRMNEIAQLLQISIKLVDWESEVLKLADSHQAFRFKLQIWRSDGGLVSPESNEPQWLITGRPYTPAPSVKSKVTYFTDYRLHRTPVSPYKTNQFLPYVLAGLFKKNGGYEDVILLDTNGNVAEASLGNIFWIKDDQVYTPSLDCGCIKGVMRAQLIALFSEFTKVQEGRYAPSFLEQADLIGCSNVSGITVFTQLNHLHFSATHPLLLKVQSKLPILS